MPNNESKLYSPRVACLLLLAVIISILFYWMIKGFLVALLIAAVLAALVNPFCCRLADWLGGRKTLASGVTVLLSLVLVIIPLLLFLGILVNEAVSISQSTEGWLNSQMQEPGGLQQQLEDYPHLKQLLPYREEILTRAGELTAKAGSLVAKGLAAGARGTAMFLLLLFVMLYAMFFFLIHGSAILDATLRFLPLTHEDETRLLGTFASVGRATLKGTLIIGIVQGGLAGLGFWVVGIPGVIFWSAIMAVLSILPGIGAALIWIPAVVYLIIEGQAGQAVGLGLWCAIVVGTIDNLLRPFLIGKDTEMPDLLVMLSTLGGLAMFGAAGILIGPIIGALYITAWKLWGSAMVPSDGVEDAMGRYVESGDGPLNADI
jgi:predicted PurR-regulated permease PerM